MELGFSEYPELSGDVIEAREISLVPGEKYEVTEALGSEVVYLGVVVLFRFPAERRWRFVFDSYSAATTGITLGLHGCAVSVAAGHPLEVAPEFMRVAGVRCSALPS